VKSFSRQCDHFRAVVFRHLRSLVARLVVDDYDLDFAAEKLAVYVLEQLLQPGASLSVRMTMLTSGSSPGSSTSVSPTYLLSALAVNEPPNRD
jgi:hypothetical protein